MKKLRTKSYIKVPCNGTEQFGNMDLFGAVRKQANTWTNIKLDRCQLASLCHNEQIKTMLSNTQMDMLQLVWVVLGRDNQNICFRRVMHVYWKP